MEVSNQKGFEIQFKKGGGENRYQFSFRKTRNTTRLDTISMQYDEVFYQVEPC